MVGGSARQAARAHDGTFFCWDGSFDAWDVLPEASLLAQPASDARAMKISINFDEKIESFLLVSFVPMHVLARESCAAGSGKRIQYDFFGQRALLDEKAQEVDGFLRGVRAEG